MKILEERSFWKLPGVQCILSNLIHVRSLKNQRIIELSAALIQMNLAKSEFAELFMVHADRLAKSMDILYVQEVVTSSDPFYIISCYIKWITTS